MSDRETLQLDVAIFGGGAAGLWLLDHPSPPRIPSLASGNPISSGMAKPSVRKALSTAGLNTHSGGLFTNSADAIKQMPEVWRQCLAGARRPDLSAHPSTRTACLSVAHPIRPIPRRNVRRQIVATRQTHFVRRRRLGPPRWSVVTARFTSLTKP